MKGLILLVLTLSIVHVSIKFGLIVMACANGPCTPKIYVLAGEIAKLQ